jgi:hypothetical protein
LSLELRHDGVEILVDPGTYCYHGEPEWRHYFRSTLAHNTVEVDDRNQSEEGGPFLWTSHAQSMADSEVLTEGGAVRSWSAYHTGYQHGGHGARHSRRVDLDTVSQRLLVHDQLRGGAGQRLRLAWHLGPRIRVSLEGASATLSWDARSGRPVSGQVLLPSSLQWTLHRGDTNPILGWYSPRFGERVPTTVLVGTGVLVENLALTTVVRLPRDAGSVLVEGSAE